MIIVVIIQFQMKHLKHTCFTLYPAFALVSMNITFNSFAFLSPSSVVTCLYIYKKANNKQTQRITEVASEVDIILSPTKPENGC